jgi:uncharacterized protein YpuA (DUF1002 family)
MRFFKTTYETIDCEFDSHAQYQKEFLDVFEINTYDDNEISKSMNEFVKNIMERKDSDIKYKKVYELIEEEEDKYSIYLNTLEERAVLLFAWDNLYRLCNIMIEM